MTGMLGMSCSRCDAEGWMAAPMRSGVGGAISTSDAAVAAAAGAATSAPLSSASCTFKAGTTASAHAQVASSTGRALCLLPIH